MYFRFDGPKILKVAVVRDGGNEKEYKGKGYGDYEVNLSLFVISESGKTDSKSKKFTYDELENILNQLNLPAQSGHVRDAKDRLQIRSIEIAKTTGEISIKVENEKLGKVASATYDFKEIKKGSWKNSEIDIAKLTNSDAEEVSKPLEKILKEVSKIHSEYENSLVYADQAREAAHHGFVAGALVNFRYRHNLRVYLEQFAGRGYADIVLVPRGKDRSLNAVPIIIELKAGTVRGTALGNALEQAKDYAKGFQPNTMRVLTISDNVLCVGLNLDLTEGEKFSMHISPREDREIAPPTMQALLKEASDWNGRQDTTTNVKEKIKQPLERIYHTFPGTPEKGGNYFSRFLLGQLLLADKFVDIDLEKSVFLYNEYPLASFTRSGAQSTERPVTTFMLTKGNQGQDKEVFIFHIREGGKGEFSGKKIPINLPTVSKITEVCISLQEERKADFFDVEKINRYNSLNEYKQGKSFFNGELKNIPYPAELKETFDKTLESQHTPQSSSVAPDSDKAFDNYKALLGKMGEGILPLKPLIEKEAHFQAVLHGAFSHYSDIRLGESQENRALVLTEFQTGRGKRIDMLVHGIKFASQDRNAKEYIPVGLELKGPRKGEKADALVKEADEQIRTEYKEGVSYKTLTDGDKVAFIGVTFDEKAEDKGSLILTGEAFQEVEVRHSSVFRFSQLQCLKRNRKKRNTGMACIDSRDEEKITKEEKEKLIKELFGIEAYDEKIITIGSPQVRIDGGKMSVKFKDNDGNDKELIIDNATNIKSIENYILDKENLEIKLKVSSDKEYAIIEEIKDQSSEYYLKIDDYRIKLDSIFQDGKEVIFDKLHQLLNDKQLLENKKYIEDIGDVQTNQDYNDIVKEIKQNLLAKGVREDTFDRFKSHFDDLGEKVFTDYISNVESSLKEKGIAFDRDKFDSAKIKGAKGGKFFSMMAIYDLLDSIGDTATLGRHNNDALKQVFGINGILDAMDDVRTSVSISPSSKVGKLIGKIPGPARQAFVKVINNPVVQSITFATIAYQFGYSINEIAQGNHHPLNYYWTTSSGVKLASMSIRPISASVSFTVKSVSATTKILRGLSATSKVLSRAAIVTMVADVLITIGIEVHERMEYTKAIAEQVPLLPGSEQAEVFFAKVIKFFTGRDVEKEYEDVIRVKGYLNQIKEVAIRLLNDNYNIAAVVQYVSSIQEKYHEVITTIEERTICMGSGIGCNTVWECGLEKKYDGISFDVTSNIKTDLSSLDISKALSVVTHTLNMQGFECALPVLGAVISPLGAFMAGECLQKSDKGERVYVVNTGAKHIPHLTKYEYEDLGLRIVDAPLTNPIPKSQCGSIINKQRIFQLYSLDERYMRCNANKIHKECQKTFTLSGEPFIFTNPKRKDPGNTKRQTFPRGSVLYISGPKTLTAAANYPAVMHIPEGSNIRYIGSKNNETIFIINNSMSGTLKGGAGKENTLVMNVKANNIAANLHSGTIRYGNSNNIRLVNTYNYVSNSDNKQNITTHCETRLINVKNAEVWQNSSNCADKDYEVRIVNKENVHHRGLKQTIFIVNEDSDNARIISDLGSTGKMKGNIDVIRVQVANITQWGISEDIEKVGYSLDVLANNTQSIVSSTKINDFKNLVIQVNSNGITESVAIQDKSLSDTIEDIRYQELKSSGSDISREVIQNSAKKLKAFIQASILDQELLDTYQIAKGIADDNNFDIPISQIEVTKNHMGVPNEKVIIASMYSGQVIVDFNYNNSDVTSSYQKYRNNRGSYSYDDYMVLCNYYQDITVEGEKTHHWYVIKLPDILNSEISSSPIRLNVKIKNKALPIPYNIIDFAELNVADIDSIGIEEGERSYINECYNKSISDLTGDSLELKDIIILDSKGTKWSLSIGLVDYFQSPENQQIVLQMNNELYKIDSTNLRLEHVEMNPNSFRYYQPEEQGLQIYHNQPISKNDIGLVDFRDKSVLGFDMEIADGSLVLSYGNSTIAKVENWSNYQPAREMMFAFNDTMVSNPKCIVSVCNSEDIIEDFNKEKVNLLKEQVFNAIVQSDISEAEDLTRKIETIDIEGKRLTPLYIAIQKGRLDIVEILFDRKHFSVKDKDIYGCNPLHWTAQQGNLNIAKFLVDKGADIGAKDNDGRTPLHVAAYSGDLDMVKFFLDKNASIEAKSSDPYKIMGVIEGVKNEIINQADTAPNVKRWAEFFVEKLRYSIKSVAKEKLKDGMLHNSYSSVNELANEIYKSDGKLFDDIIKGVINDVYGRVDTKEILSYVRSHNNAGQRISGYVAVFDAMQRNDDLNNSAIFKLAYSIKEAMSFDKYSSLDSGRKSELERLKNKLPESLRNAVFSSKVCIKNIYQNEYLYAANSCFNYDSNRRRVFTWILKGALTDKFKWKIKLDGDNFNIVNAEFNENLYAASDYFNYDNDRRMVFTWVSGGGVARDVWMIKPDGNNCSIMNVKLKEHLYAADYSKYDKDRRSVFTWIPGGKVTQGVWKIEDCGSSIRKGRSKVEDTSAVDNTGGAFSFNQSLVEPPICNISVNNHFEESVDVNSTDENGWTLLHLAAWKGQLDNARLLIEKGADINAENIFGRKPIHVAAESNNTNIIEFFLSKGMNVDDTDRYGRTPLYCASWNGHLGVVKYLVEKGADINAQDKGGETSLDAATDQKHEDVVGYLKQVQLDQELLIAAQYGNFDEVRDLVSQGASLNAKYSNGMTVMHSAAYGGNLDIVKYFVADAKNSLEIKDNGGRVSLHYAAYNGKLDVVKYFVDEGEVDVNLKDSDGQTALHMASGGGHLDVVGYLTSKGADIKAKDKDGKTPLDIAIDRKHDSIVKYLKQAQLNEQLLAAVQDSDFSKVKDLINLGADVNIKDKDGKTPLHYVSRSDHHLGMVKYLISKGADIDVKDHSGRTPEDEERYTNSGTIRQVFMQAHLDKELLLTVKNEKDLKTISDLIAKDIDDRTHGGFYYTWSGNLGTVEFLVSKDVSVNATDKYGCTLLHWATLKGHLDIAKFLIGKGANVNAKDILGRTPIHFAVMNNHVNITEFLLNQGVSVDETDKNGSTPLHYAAEFSELDSARFLIEKGANINTADNSGKKPIHVASENNNKNIIELFLSKGVSVDNADKDGWTSLHYAARRGCLGATEFLIEKGADTKVKDKNGQVPLCVAAQYNKPDIIDFLLNRGATIEASDFNDGPILKLAYCIKGVMEKINNKEQISHFEELKSKLPESIKNAVFSSKVCIKNLYQNEYLYAASSDFNYDDERRRVFTWIPVDKKDGKFKWKIEPYGDGYSIMNVEFNEYLYAAIDDFNFDKDRRKAFTWIPGGKDEQSLWRLEYFPNSGNIYMMNVEFNEYLYAADYGKYDDNRRRVFTWIPGGYIRQGTWEIENCESIHKKRDIQELDGKAGSDSLEAIKVRARNKSSDSQLLALPGRLDNHLLDGSNRTRVGKFVSQVANTKDNEEREKPAQRKRRHHHGDHARHHMSRKPLAIDSSDQPEITASSGTRPSSWINNCISWAKKLAASTFSIIPALPSQYNIADKNNVKSDNKNIPQSTSSVGWNKFLNNENIALASCVADALDNTPSRRYQGLMSKGVEVVPSSRVAVEFALKKFNSFVEDKIRNLESKEQARIHVELKDAYPEIIASLERGVEFSGNVGLDNVLEKSKKRFCANVLQKDKVSTCLSGVGVTKLENNLSR
ncbi:ankyrin repeat domain-containing protein [Wolbachia endosymbiont (group A) of Gymnosoma rotundatum]|uniref:ankyrin repeat domain-containing protein n=1 Tax=Wolbachia endosymbiont (group A) of Gymnosoma rotundatum TaxID=2954016 RepID=UPI002225C7A1|nr:ankyrin repeat domain-containing protein [Wolbachia endosymbiont (group A) of Gymnosoma rotundatum]